MSNRLDYYFRQLVTEDELNRGFQYAEDAEHRIVVDQGLTGIVAGQGVGENTIPDLNVQVGSGVAYSRDGERINVPAPQIVDMSEDDAGAPTAVVTPGNEKWLSLFVVFDRILSDPRVDGNGDTVYFERAEGFEFSVVQGAEAAAGTATRPPIDSGKILLADMLITHGQTAIVNAGINVDRREGRTLPLASAPYGGGPPWADGTPNPPTNVEAQLDKIVGDLGQSEHGSNRILSGSIAGTPNALPQASIFAQIGALLSALNTHLLSAAAHTPGNVGAVALAAADTITALKTLGTGGALATQSGRGREVPIITEARTAGAGAVVLRAGDISIVVDNGRVDILDGCTLDAAANQWIALRDGDAHRISIGSEMLRDQNQDPDSPGSGFSLYTNVGVTTGDTWSDGAWGDRTIITDAHQSDKQGSLAGVKSLINPNMVAAGHVIFTLDTSGSGSIASVQAGSGLDSAAVGLPVTLPGADLIQILWEMDAVDAADQITYWQVLSGNPAHGFSTGHTINSSIGSLLDFAGASIATDSNTGTYTITATRFILGD